MPIHIVWRLENIHVSDKFDLFNITYEVEKECIREASKLPLSFFCPEMKSIRCASR